MYKLNEMLATSKKLIAKSWKKLITFFTTKIVEIPLPSLGCHEQ